MEEISIEEMAIDFVDRFYEKLHSNIISVSGTGDMAFDSDLWRHAKECALIAADELELMAMFWAEDDVIDWWQQMKKQIINL